MSSAAGGAVTHTTHTLLRHRARGTVTGLDSTRRLTCTALFASGTVHISRDSSPRCPPSEGHRHVRCVPRNKPCHSKPQGSGGRDEWNTPHIQVLPVVPRLWEQKTTQHGHRGAGGVGDWRVSSNHSS